MGTPTRAAAATPTASAAPGPAGTRVWPGKKKHGITVVLPEGYDRDPAAFEHQPVYGAFLVDSFSYMVEHGSWRTEYYLARLLKELWLETGYVFMAVYCGGAALVRDYASVTYAQLLAEVPQGLELVITVIMGNDFYVKKSVRSWNGAMEQAMRDLCTQLRAKAKHAFVVLGACAHLHSQWCPAGQKHHRQR